MKIEYHILFYVYFRCFCIDLVVTPINTKTRFTHTHKKKQYLFDFFLLPYVCFYYVRNSTTNTQTSHAHRWKNPIMAYIFALHGNPPYKWNSPCLQVVVCGPSVNEIMVNCNVFRCEGGHDHFIELGIPLEELYIQPWTLTDSTVQIGNSPMWLYI